MLRVVACLALELVVAAAPGRVEAWTPLYFLADEVAAADGLAEPTRGIVGSDSVYVVRNRSAHVATRQLHVPAGSELRLRLGLDASTVRGRRARFSIRARPPHGPSATMMTRAFRANEATWVETRVALAEVVDRLGPELRFLFKARAEGDTVPLWGDPIVVTPTTDALRTPPFNVILLSIDTLRADRLGCYGGPPTPTLDRIAAQGTLFEIAEGASPSTRRSHATMMTGVYPCVHRLGVEPGDELPAGLATLAQILRAQGWATAAVTEGGYLDAVFARGFGTWRVDAAGTLDQPAGRVEDVVADARAWLANHADARFFLFLQTYQPHFPYTPPERYRTPREPRIPRSPAVVPAQYETYDPDLYDGEVRYTDDALAPLFATLAELGLDRNTLVIVTSDHGEAFGEHGHFLHGEQLYEEDLRIPLLWWAPGRIPPGRRLQAVASLADIVPTVLDFAEAWSPPWLQGRTLARGLGPEPPRFQGENMAYSELFDPNAPTHPTAVRGGGWKSIFSFPYVPGSPMTLFTLATDPQERRPKDISRERGVSWTFYLTQQCERASRLLADAAERSEPLK